MAKVIQSVDFFVVGGPVQPDRACYVDRPADRQLEAAIAERQWCCVLGPRAIGKTSLMGSVARALRAAGELCAVVDLAQLGARNDDTDAARWAYAIATKVAHELKLKIDLAAWWQEQAAVGSDSVLADFFWEVVLTQTAAPVTVFIDEIDQALALPFADELFAAIDVCYSRRSTDADYHRLSFVLLGAATLRQVAGGRHTALFAGAQSIDLGDFTAEESYRLALGFGGEQAQTQALMDRVCAWTGGHPYLTQKVARGVARKGGKLEDVERVVREQLLVPGVAQDDAPFNHARAVLMQRTPAARQALRLLKRVAKGGKVAAPVGSPPVEVLELAGVVAVDEQRVLRYRNRIYKELFGARWLKTVTPRGWRIGIAAAVALAAIAGAAFWYAKLLPLPYIDTLVRADDAPAVQSAYERLHRLPGFAQRADLLLAESLARRSGGATTLAALAANDTELRKLAGGDVLADRLQSEFWLRKAEAAGLREQRDAALLFALRAAALPQGAALLAELVGDDYRRLERTLRWPMAPAFWNVDWQTSTLLAVDSAHRLQRVTLAAPSNGGDAASLAVVSLTALQHTPLTRALRVDGPGSAGAFELSAALAHPASGELLLTLTAPSGAQASVVAPQSAAGSENFVFQAAEGSPLEALADEAQRGVWRLSVIDRSSGNVGTLVGWSLSFGDDDWHDDPAEPVAIPDPERTADVAVTATPAAGFALVQPTKSGPIGTVALWSLGTGTLQSDFALPLPPQRVALNASATRLLAVTGDALTLWNAGDGTQVARLATQTAFVLPPTFSADGGYFAIAERVDDSRPLYSLLSSQDGSLLASVEGGDDARDWLLGPGARYVALLDSSSVVRVLDPRRGVELARLQHASEVRRVLPLADGVALLTVDAGGDLLVWRLDAAADDAPAGRLLGTTGDAAGVSVSADGSRVAYTDASGDVIVRDLASGAAVQTLRAEPGSPVTAARLAPDGARIATASVGTFRSWSLPTAAPDVARAASPSLTVAAVDAAADRAALGFRGGQLRVRNGAELAAAGAATGGLDFFGHRGAVTAVALAGAHNLAATGGADGAVRVWDVTTGVPMDIVLRPSNDDAGRIVAVALGADGKSVASAARDAARWWQVADGTLAAELAVQNGATAVAISADGAWLAAGDGGGTILVRAGGDVATKALRASAAIRSLAFAATGVLASGDAGGNVRLWRTGDAAAVGTAQSLLEPVRWVGFDPSGAVLLAATEHWLHSFAVSDLGLAPLHARFAPRRFAPDVALAALGDERVRLVGIDSGGVLGSETLDLAAHSGAADSSLAGRDWPATLALRLDDAGEPVALIP